jgi:MFS family permease
MVMRAAIDLLKTERRTPVFFAAHIQSAFGTGAGYVALLLIAYERFHSPWAITAILLAEFLPGMFLGPFVGAAADRWSRKGLLVGADVIRAIAFAGLVLVGSFEATVALAVLAGTGNAIFTPTVMAALPRFVGGDRFPAATSLYNSINESGFTAGPALAALVFVFAGAESVMAANSVSFLISAVALMCLSFGGRAPRTEEEQSAGLVRGAWSGLRTAAADSGFRTLLVISGATVFTMGMINVAELLLAREVLGVGNSEFSMLVAAMGAGIAAGSLFGCSGGSVAKLKRNMLRGIFLCAGAVIAAGLAPTFWVALPAFAAMGIGNGAIISYEGVLMQTVVPDHLLGRFFGIKNSVVSWCFAGAFLSGGALTAAIGPRAIFVLAGIGTLAVCWYGSVKLRSAWTEPSSVETEPAIALGDVAATPAEAFFGLGPSLAGERA